MYVTDDFEDSLLETDGSELDNDEEFGLDWDNDVEEDEDEEFDPYDND